MRCSRYCIWCIRRLDWSGLWAFVAAGTGFLGITRSSITLFPRCIQAGHDYSLAPDRPVLPVPLWPCQTDLGPRRYRSLWETNDRPTALRRRTRRPLDGPAWRQPFAGEPGGCAPGCRSTASPNMPARSPPWSLERLRRVGPLADWGHRHLAFHTAQLIEFRLRCRFVAAIRALVRMPGLSACCC